jgi:hypothetical protein
MPVWRRDDAGQGHALKLTAGGLKAIAVDEGSEGAIEPSKAPQPQPLPDETNASRPDAVGEQAKTSPPRVGGKLARVIDLLQRCDGATIPNLTEATGWLPHTTRAALTGLREHPAPDGQKDDFNYVASWMKHGDGSALADLVEIGGSEIAICQPLGEHVIARPTEGPRHTHLASRIPL